MYGRAYNLCTAQWYALRVQQCLCRLEVMVELNELFRIRAVVDVDLPVLYKKCTSIQVHAR